MDILKKNRFPIVTLDLSIPDKQSGGPDIKNGLLLLEYLRSQSPNTRVVVLTNYDTDEVKGAAVLRKLSPDRFVTKNRSDIGLFMADMVENLKEEWECDINHFSRGNLITLSRTDRTQCMINGKYFKDVCSSHLTKTDYELLKALANNERHIKREELIKYWVENMNKTQESFDSALKRLRTKLSDLTQLNKDGIILHLGDNTYYMPDFQIQIVD